MTTARSPLPFPGNLLGLQILRDGLHLAWAQIFDDAVHDGRHAQLALNHLQLANNIFRMLPCEARKDRDPCSIRTVAAGTRRNTRFRIPILIQHATLFNESRVPRRAR